MGKLKKKLLYIGLSATAYISPGLMILSLFTNYWLHSSETVVVPTAKDKPTTTTTTTTRAGFFFGFSNTTIKTTTKNVTIKQFYPLDHIEAMYGLWEICKITDTSRRKQCETIKHFHGSDAEVRLTDILKKQIGICIIPILTALLLMASSVILHTYACLRNKTPHLFLISGCIFIFAGLASLTGLIVFIAAVNGAVDSQLTASQMSEEPQFVYKYGLSFFCAILSFLMQEINGICNVYWYVGHYSKYRYEQQQKQNILMNINNISKPIANFNSKIDIIRSNEDLNKMSTIYKPNDTLKIGFTDTEKILKENAVKQEASFENINNNKSLEREILKNSLSNLNIHEKVNPKEEKKDFNQNFDTNKNKLLNIKNYTTRQNNSHIQNTVAANKNNNNSPSIKFIIDERLTAPLSLNILPACYSNKLKKSFLNPKAVVLNENDFNTTSSLSYTASSQSTTPQISSAATTSQESSPNSTLTSSSSSNSTLSQGDTSVTEFQINTAPTENKFIKPVSGTPHHFKTISKFTENTKPSVNFLIKNPIDLENNDDDLKAKFYKLPLKTQVKENIELSKNQNRINNLKFINTRNSNYSKSFDHHQNNINNSNKLYSNSLSKNISYTCSNDLKKYSCDKSINEASLNTSSFKEALKKHEQTQIYQNYLVEKYLKKQQKKENEIEYLKNLLINSTEIPTISSQMTTIAPSSSYSGSTLQDSPSNFLMQKIYQVSPSQINDRNPSDTAKRQEPNYTNIYQTKVHNSKLNVNNSTNQHHSKLFDYNNNSFDNNLYLISNNSPNLIGNPYNNRPKRVTIEPNMSELRIDSNLSRLLKNRNKYKPKYQRNKSTDYQPVTRYIIEDELANNTGDINSPIAGFNSSTLKRILGSDVKETNSKINKSMTINPVSYSITLSNETNAQRLRRNLKRTTSV